MEELVKSFLAAPLANVLIVSGIFFLLIAVVGSISPRIRPGVIARFLALVIGAILLSVGLLLHLQTQIPSSPNGEVPPKAPVLNFTFEPKAVRPGHEVQLFLDPPRQNVVVFYNGQPLPKHMLSDAGPLVVTIPGDAKIGFGSFELEWEGRRYTSPEKLEVIP